MRRVCVLSSCVVERPCYVLGGQRAHLDQIPALGAIKVDIVADKDPDKSLFRDIRQVCVVKVFERLAIHRNRAAVLRRKLPLPAGGDIPRVASLAHRADRVALVVISGFPAQKRLLEAEEAVEQHIRPGALHIAELRRTHIVEHYSNGYRRLLRRYCGSGRRLHRGRSRCLWRGCRRCGCRGCCCRAAGAGAAAGASSAPPQAASAMAAIATSPRSQKALLFICSLQNDMLATIATELCFSL